MTTETALTLAQRASVAIGAPAYEIALEDMVQESAGIVNIKDKDGYHQAHSARMRLKGIRVEIQKRAKDAREDATAFSKAVVAEEKRLVAMVEPEEGRLQGLQDAFDAAREAEKQARIKAEQERIARHQGMIETIRGRALKLAGASSSAVLEEIQQFEKYCNNSDSVAEFEEFSTAADKAKFEAMAALRELHSVAVAREEEAARLKAEREELEMRRAEQERVAAEERARIAEAQRIESERLAEERRKFDEERRAAREKQAEEERKAAALRKAEEDRIAAERAELKRQQDAIEAEQRKRREEAEAKVRAEQEAEEAKLAEEEAERKRRQDAANAKTWALRDAIDAELDRCTDEQLSDVLTFAKSIQEKVSA